MQGKNARYVVIESTPGFLTDDDDTATFDDLSEARIYASDLLSQLLDHIYEGQALDTPESEAIPGFTVHGSFQSDLSVVVYDSSRTHDLGRVIEILIEILETEGDDQ